tara:strand:- start:1223 stop:1927 length:705 start_codon:yes stop_codon:yes gene_type:complete
MSKKQTGRNTPSGKELLAYIERIELLRKDKQQLADDEKAIFAEAKARGFDAPTMRKVIARRAADENALAEAQDMLDLYLHAVGMEAETPLFRAVGLMSVDVAARDQVIAALSQLVPSGGEIIVRAGGQPVRLFRDGEGNVNVEDYHEPKPQGEKPAGRKPEAKAPPPKKPRRNVPDVSEGVAFELGGEAFRKGEPITSNPFPHDDKRRAKFDAGWRTASGTDGMGPSDGSGDGE